jgi:hypothetical protein
MGAEAVNRDDREVKTLVTLEVTTFGHETHRRKSLDRMMKELKLQGFTVRQVGGVVVIGGSSDRPSLQDV